MASGRHKPRSGRYTPAKRAPGPGPVPTEDVRDHWGLSDKGAAQWADFVRSARRDAAAKIAKSAYTMVLLEGPNVDPEKVDVKFAVELGLSLLYDKPMVAVIPAGQLGDVPLKLRTVVDYIIEVEADVDSPEFSRELAAKLVPIMAVICPKDDPS